MTTNTDSITPGRIAYHAYCAERQWKAFNGGDLPHYEQLKEDPSKQGIVEAWEMAGKAVLLHGFGVLRPKEGDVLPEVAGPLTVPKEALEQRARVLLRDEQEKPLPDNALIDLLCNMVRLVRSQEKQQGPMLYFPKWTFKKGDRVRHRGGGDYYITHAKGDNVYIEATGEEAYIYVSRAANKLWVRPAHEMEDGRFALFVEVPQDFQP